MEVKNKTKNSSHPLAFKLDHILFTLRFIVFCAKKWFRKRDVNLVWSAPWTAPRSAQISLTVAVEKNKRPFQFFSDLKIYRRYVLGKIIIFVSHQVKITEKMFCFFCILCFWDLEYYKENKFIFMVTIHLEMHFSVYETLYYSSFCWCNISSFKCIIVHLCGFNWSICIIYQLL